MSMNISEHDILVSAYAALTPLGGDAMSSYEGLLSQRSVYRVATSLDLSDHYFRQKQFAEIPEEIMAGVAIESVPEQAQATRLTLLAVEQALRSAELPEKNLADWCIGLALTTLESQSLEKLSTHTEGEKDGLLDLADPLYTVNALRARLGCRGPAVVLSNACASGNHSIAAGMDMIRSGEVDLCIVGGACKIFRSAVVGFHQFTGISLDTCRPFDLGRSGTMLGDGAGILILERASHAWARGHRPNLHVAGYGLSCDSHDMMAPHPDGLGMVMAMERALQAAGLAGEAIDYINAHGTGTLQNDRLETKAIRDVFQAHVKQLLVSSTKSQLGHSLYAASALEAVWCCLAIERQIAPPTWNYRQPDPECNLNVVPNAPHARAIRYCMNNSFGFGGANASVIFGQN